MILKPEEAQLPNGKKVDIYWESVDIQEGKPIKASLAKELKLRDDKAMLNGEFIPFPDAFLFDPEWGMSQKMDGHRLIVQSLKYDRWQARDKSDIRTTTQISAYNRDGNYYTKDYFDLGHALKDISPNWILDGELVGGMYYLFDVLSSPQIPHKTLTQQPLTTRQTVAQRFVETLGSPVVKYVPLVTTGKLQVFEEMRAAGAEGVIFKKLDAPYQEGRNNNFIKCKFKHDVDCIVTDVGVDSKSNIELAFWDPQTQDLYPSRHYCSSLSGDGPIIRKGDIVKVNILYSTKDGKLAQPTFPLLRNDKKAEECTIDQLETTITTKDYFYDRY